MEASKPARSGVLNCILARSRVHACELCQRDFTYVDDIVEGVVRVIGRPPADCGTGAKYKVYNIGNSEPVQRLEFVGTLQRVLVEEGVLPADYDFEAHRELVPMQPGDVVATYADATKLQSDFGYCPNTSLEDGLRAFAKWCKDYYVC